jgi:hypothetical protein
LSVPFLFDICRRIETQLCRRFLLAMAFGAALSQDRLNLFCEIDFVVGLNELRANRRQD